jgi:tetratricopeptide (TPR) repeat protein
MMKLLLIVPALFAINGFNESDLIKARDRQDKAALEKMVGDLKPAADKDQKDAAAQYRLALAESYSAEVAIETHDKAAAKNAAQAGIDAAERAVGLKPDSSEYQRILGTLCGQMISGQGLAGLKYGKCALTAVNRAIELDPKSSINYLSHGVGNYYLPAALGGGFDLAIKDFQKAIELDSKNADAYLWLGIALRKVNQPEEARKAIAKSLDLNPSRMWAKQQLDKTPTPAN